MNKEEILKLLRSGNFSLLAHDNGEFELYEGHIDYDDIPQVVDPDTGEEEYVDGVAMYEMHQLTNGYSNELLDILVEALNGHIDSI